MRFSWALQCQRLGRREICVNSIDADGTKNGYELVITSMIADAVNIPVIASGGCGKPEHIYDRIYKKAMPRRPLSLPSPSILENTA